MANNKESGKAEMNNGVETEKEMTSTGGKPIQAGTEPATGASVLPEEKNPTSETGKNAVTGAGAGASPESKDGDAAPETGQKQETGGGVAVDPSGTASAAVKARGTKKKRIIAVVAVLVVVALVAVYFLFFYNRSGPNRAVTAGQNIVVTVMADKLEGVYGYQFEMSYDTVALEFVRDALVSKIDDISMIFSVDQGSYELVGATMIGEASGASGQDMAVCEMIFTAKKDGTLADYNLVLQNVNVVDSNLEYIENVEGWYCTFAVEN